MKKTIVVLTTIFLSSILFAGLPEGWINNSTFRTIGIGMTRVGFNNHQSRQASACRAALLTAKYNVLANMCKGTVFTKNNITASTISGRIKGGNVINKVFDGSTNSCRIVFEIDRSDVNCNAGQ